MKYAIYIPFTLLMFFNASLLAIEYDSRVIDFEGLDFASTSTGSNVSTNYAEIELLDGDFLEFITFVSAKSNDTGLYNDNEFEAASYLILIKVGQNTYESTSQSIVGPCIVHIHALRETPYLGSNIHTYPSISGSIYVSFKITRTPNPQPVSQ